MSEITSVAFTELAGALNGDADYQRDLHIDASPEAVFAALTTVSGITGWWGPATGSGIQGGELRLAFSHDHPQVFHVDTAQRMSRVLWRVLDGAWLPDWTGTTISFELRSGPSGGCQLKFRHQGLTPQLVCYDDCRRGWDFVLPSLGHYAGTGTGSPFQPAPDIASRQSPSPGRMSPSV
ncbi:MAG: SRPBCC family protein [Chloroflexota bacterium]